MYFSYDFNILFSLAYFKNTVHNTYHIKHVLINYAASKASNQ